MWPDGDVAREPQLFDAHMEEVRSGHVEEPADAHAPTEGGGLAWDERMSELGARYPRRWSRSSRPTASRSRCACRSRSTARPAGCGSAARRWECPGSPGLACLTAHDHDAGFKWQRNFQVRGDLVEEDGAWALIPHKLVGGFELPPSSLLARVRLNAKKMRRSEDRQAELARGR